ncbi:MAG: DUF4867 family protein [Sphaerochaetaceae bacterium]|nr:DUF4867 family protein [Sphaerochaetaceae bacterium]
MIKTIQNMNPDKEIRPVTDPSVSRYGYVMRNIETESLIELSLSLFEDKEGTQYIPSDQRMEALPVKSSLERLAFGELLIQVGCCYGMNHHLNGMEYHATNELIIAATDLVLMLGKVQDIREDGTWHSANTEFYYMNKGEALVIYSSTLHLAPCRVSEDPFNAIIVLPKGTNEALSGEPHSTLFKNNKWMLAHQEGPAAKNGALVKTVGVNIELTVN